ncbi:patatin-like phospholipase family protein [Nocardioides sp. CFH 31398]|uniref:patatin-like phospholipase family protein n=1 Tax=Nocardioides sp. CFH 31398 TaxID=2919579 RepID=UPI001F060CE0|nr:patatin-like phospholipase family protein [Nocardioides sp. CFH 31398]MCH1869051.1 patatin-like phospholipase family protein [Nocardioides sp. CFH 31398]
MAGTRGLVLGGGGITGIAWETGLLAGLLEHGVDLTGADVVVGTSAGSVVGAQLTSGTTLADLYAEQVPDVLDAPTPPSFGLPVVAGAGLAVLRARGDIEKLGRNLGAWAVRRARRGATPPLEERVQVIGERLPSTSWPTSTDLRIAVVDATTGERRVLDRDSGVPLLDAVAASCAVPGVYPPVPIDGRPHVDGGAHSAVNADLARDCDLVVAIAPIAKGLGPMENPYQQLAGHSHVVVRPDDASRTAIGKNVLDLAARGASARAGHAQAAAVAAEVRELWG